jgi:hypothetical protein
LTRLTWVRGSGRSFAGAALPNAGRGRARAGGVFARATVSHELVGKRPQSTRPIERVGRIIQELATPAEFASWDLPPIQIRT